MVGGTGGRALQTMVGTVVGKEKDAATGGLALQTMAKTTNTAAAAATLALDLGKTRKHIETIRLALGKILKTPVKFEKWLVQHDKASTGLLSREDLEKIIEKVAQRVGNSGGAKQSMMEITWASVKKGSGKEVARDQVEHGVVKKWVFVGVQQKEKKPKTKAEQ